MNPKSDKIDSVKASNKYKPKDLMAAGGDEDDVL